MASSTFRTRLNLKVTFLNDLVSRSKRSFEEFQEEEQPDTKRHKLSCLPFGALADPSSSSNGIAVSAVCSVATNGQPDDSNTDDILDDSLLEPSDGELSDFSTGLTSEAEDELLSDSQPHCPETSNSIAFEPDAEHVGILCALGSSKPSGTLDLESRKTEPLSPADPLVCSSSCRNDSESPESGSDLSTGSQNQAGFGLDSNSSVLPEAVSVAAAALSLQKDNNVPGVLDKEAAQAVVDDNLERVRQLMAKPERAEGPCKEQASLNQNDLGEESANSPPQEAEGDLDSAGLHEEAAPSCSTSIGDQRKGYMEGPSIKESNCPIRSRCRIYIEEAKLESSKEKYINAVLAHAQRAELIDEVNELQQLMFTVTAENRYGEPGFAHPTDLTVRNYAQRAKSTAHRCSLDQWVDRNNRNLRRFESVPDRFRRSPIPS
ncbi:S100P-binding protein [Podarcis raffonei]|uniref:S100P-binding protein n=1 Tax=Podarcis raffonei TaxID=65483 RepID=UPI002329802F|nr:S100P-binding protein [Podarcis raffonei]XP_053255053.1 S100P-binding protein [Podarcis raffonei]XP_053255054.1 S100P-binding protein [Podarcis raffonei]